MDKKDTPFEMLQIAGYQDHGIVSVPILESPAGNVTVFAFDHGQQLSEHTAPFDALVTVIEGEGQFQVGERVHILKSGKSLIMPARIPHSVNAVKRFKMVLVMIRGGDAQNP